MEATMAKKYTSPDWADVPIVLSTQQAADALGVHLNTIKRLVLRKKIRAFKVGRVLKIHKAELMKYVGFDVEDYIED